MLQPGEVKTKVKLVFQCLGIKSTATEDSYVLPKSDVYIDCRGLVNPAHGGPGGTGDDIEVQAWVEKGTNIGPYIQLVHDGMRHLTTRKGAGHEFDHPFVVTTMCAHGVHRSRAMKNILARVFKNSGYSVEVK